MGAARTVHHPVESHRLSQCSTTSNQLRSVRNSMTHFDISRNMVKYLLWGPWKIVTPLSTGVTGHNIPPARIYPGLKRPRLDYTRVYYGLGQFTPRGILWPRPIHTSSGQNIPS